MPADDRQRAQQIVTALQELGCDDPQAWARYEISENSSRSTHPATIAPISGPETRPATAIAGGADGRAQSRGFRVLL